MKIKTPLVAALLFGMPAISSAFTLDAVGYEGGELSSNPVSVFVPGYGEVIFEALVGTLVVNSAYVNDNGFGGPSLSFDENESIKVTFNGLPPLKAQAAFVGVSSGEEFVVEKDLVNPQAYVITLKGSGDGAGLYAIGWTTEAIPEPTSAMLGLIGTAAFVFRRRR